MSSAISKHSLPYRSHLINTVLAPLCINLIFFSSLDSVTSPPSYRRLEAELYLLTTISYQKEDRVHLFRDWWYPWVCCCIQWWDTTVQTRLNNSRYNKFWKETVITFILLIKRNLLIYPEYLIDSLCILILQRMFQFHISNFLGGLHHTTLHYVSHKKLPIYLPRNSKHFHLSYE